MLLWQISTDLERCQLDVTHSYGCTNLRYYRRERFSDIDSWRISTVGALSSNAHVFHRFSRERRAYPRVANRLGHKENLSRKG
jgi:hypothetical protein